MIRSYRTNVRNGTDGISSIRSTAHKASCDVGLAVMAAPEGHLRVLQFPLGDDFAFGHDQKTLRAEEDGLYRVSGVQHHKAGFFPTCSP